MNSATPRRAAARSVRPVAWSPDGSRVACPALLDRSDDDVARVVARPLDGGAASELTHLGDRLAYEIVRLQLASGLTSGHEDRVAVQRRLRPAAQPHSQRARHPQYVRAALAVGAGISGCDQHNDAGACFRACAADALVAVRTSPNAARARASELSQQLPEPARWQLLAASRDPWMFVERAMDALAVNWREKQQLRLRDLAPDGSTLNASGRTIVVPTPMRELLANFRAIRITEGGIAIRPLLIPHDDRARRRWRAARTPAAHAG